MDDAERYRRLAESLLQRVYGFDQVEARLGAVPEEWPRAVTTPPGVTLVGSVTRRRDGRLASMTLYLEAISSGAPVLQHYEDALRREGWTRYEPERTRTGMVGFRSAIPPAGAVRVFCRAETDPFYNVHIAEREGRIDAVVVWDAGLDHHPLRVHPGPYGPGGPLGHLIPDLAAPEGVVVQGGGGGGSEYEWETRGRARTSMPVLALAGHYGPQLVSAGWTLRDEGGDAVVQWSRWKLPKDDYEGMLVVAEPLADVRDLTLVIRSPSRAARSWRGWAASTYRPL